MSSKAVLLQSIAYLRVSLIPILNKFIYQQLSRNLTKAIPSCRPGDELVPDSLFEPHCTTLEASIRQSIDSELIQILQEHVQSKFDFSPKQDKANAE